jgi:predicted membrane protein
MESVSLFRECAKEAKMSGSNYGYDDELQKKRFMHGGVYAGHGGKHNHLVLGIIVLLLGILFLLENLGMFHVGNLWSYWPVILIGIGFARILDSDRMHGKLWGATIIGAGAVLLANSLHYLPWNLWRLFWPASLIVWGIALLMKGFGRRSRVISIPAVEGDIPISNDKLREDVVFGGINRKVQARDFQGGKINAVFGGIEIDLRGSTTTKEEIKLEVNAVFGGVELTVPDSWEVIVQGSGFLGGYEDKTRPLPVSGSGKQPRLIIHGGAVFGGVTVRN